MGSCAVMMSLTFFVLSAAAWFQGRPYVDGSLQDFVLWRNSEKLTCGGSAFIIDYSQVRLPCWVSTSGQQLCAESSGWRIYHTGASASTSAACHIMRSAIGLSD